MLPIQRNNNTLSALGATVASPPKWHAHLSALPLHELSAAGARAARPAAVPQVEGRALSETRAWTEVFDPALLGRAVTIRPVLVQGVLSCSDCGGNVVDIWPADDGSGRQRWVLVDTDAPGEYNIVVYGGRECEASTCWYVGAAAEGKAVGLYPGDDGSGRQRWSFRQVGDATYAVRLAGGKKDDKVYLGIDEDTRVRLYAKVNGRPSMWNISPIPFCDADIPEDLEDLEDLEDPEDPEDPEDQPPEQPPEQQPPAADSKHVPASAVDALKGSFTAAQLDVVMQLISLPENGHPKWYDTYGYIEFLGDGRGFTSTIFGACSGTGDLYMVFEELAKDPERSPACDKLLKYKKALKGKRGDDIEGIEGIKPLISKMGDDPAWRRAVWKVYVDLYWRQAVEWCGKKGQAARRPGPVLTLPASRGFMVDSYINHGSYESMMYIVKRMKNAGSKDEAAWVRDFADARKKILKSGYEDLDTSKTGDRCELWKALLRDNPGLQLPIKAYEGYWGSYTLK